MGRSGAAAMFKPARMLLLGQTPLQVTIIAEDLLVHFVGMEQWLTHCAQQRAGFPYSVCSNPEPSSGAASEHTGLLQVIHTTGEDGRISIKGIV